jgi:predicted ATPase/class 3 adenylate cyclase/DNA-binding CsgD family transcriptional regulator
VTDVCPWDDPLVTSGATGHEAETSLPTGTVTLLLADIEGSTQLWEQRGDEMPATLLEFDETVSTLVAQHQGARPLEQGEGDSFVAAFARASDAVACAVALQQALRAGPIRLRMGLHAGEVQLRDAGNYIGAAINRAARLRDAGHGNQVLLSQTVVDLARDHLPTGAGLLDLGAHGLRDLERPEHVWQIVHPDLPDAHPPLRSLDVVRNNLPVQLTSFVGRARELEQLHQLLGESRCVTLTGSGGCGKTRLAMQAAADRLDDHPSGVWAVDLSTFDTEDAVASAVAQVLSLAPLPSGTEELVVRTIGASRTLLLLDNCEHLIEACAAMAELLLRRCPGVTIIATSREPLGVPGEVTFRVPSLAYPKAAGAKAEELAGFDAVQLFVERGRRARPSFAITDANAGEVLEICKRLEGIPLALELAAARLRVMSAAQIRDGLHDRFRLLTGGARTAVPRQQTLQASVDWSYGLLSDPERRVLDRLSVFSGGFTMAGAEAVCSDGGGVGDVLDLVLALVDKSLVVAEDEAESRFTLLETVRQYAASRLADAGDSEAVRRRHYDHCVALCRNQSAHGDTDGSYRAAVTADYDNLRRALQWASEQDEPALLGRLATRLYLFWSTSWKMRDGVAWFELVVEREDDPARRASALSRLAQLLSLIGEPARSQELLAESLELTETTGDRRASLWAKLTTANDTQDPELFGELIELAGELGDHEAQAFALFQKGFRSMAFESPEPAALIQARDLARREHVAWVERMANAGLALMQFAMGDVADALPALEASAAELSAAGEGTLLGTVLATLASVQELTGDSPGADETLRQLAAFGDEVNAGGAAMRSFAGRAFVATNRQDWDEAIRLVTTAVSFATGPNRYTSLVMLALIECFAGLPDRALVHLDEAARSPHAGDHFDGIAGIPIECAEAYALLGVGDASSASDRAYVALELLAARPLPAHSRQIILNLVAECQQQLGHPEEAIRLFAGVEAYARSVGVQAIATITASDLAAETSGLEPARIEALRAEGEAMSLDELVAYAMRGRGERRRPSSGWAALTPTERQVAGLVAEGQSNKDVAARLFMSVATVKTHLTHVYAKLGLTTRAQLAAAAARRD